MRKTAHFDFLLSSRDFPPQLCVFVNINQQLAQHFPFYFAVKSHRFAIYSRESESESVSESKSKSKSKRSEFLIALCFFWSVTQSKQCHIHKHWEQKGKNCKLDQSYKHWLVHFVRTWTVRLSDINWLFYEQIVFVCMLFYVYTFESQIPQTKYRKQSTHYKWLLWFWLKRIVVSLFALINLINMM